MGSNSETGRLKENSKPRAGGEDRISRLPDAVLCHILSLIPTKYAVRSSIVSNRWKNMWASAPNLDFEDRSNRCIAEKKYKCDTVGFSTLVDRVLSLRDSSIDITCICFLNYNISAPELNTLPVYAGDHHRVAKSFQHAALYYTHFIHIFFRIRNVLTIMMSMST